MSAEQIGIADMQCRVFRMAQLKWHLSASACADLFRKYKLLDFIAECYGVLHISSYECAVEDLEDILASKGVNVC